jgi:hypothetical protein
MFVIQFARPNIGLHRLGGWGGVLGGGGRGEGGRSVYRLLSTRDSKEVNKEHRRGYDFSPGKGFRVPYGTVHFISFIKGTVETEIICTRQWLSYN